MTYRPREFWEQRLREQFDLRGTGETGLSLAYNQACYELRRNVLERALREAGFDPRDRSVLDVGCGTGFFTAFYLERGARVTGLDLTAASVQGLRRNFPEARFEQGDISDTTMAPGFDLVNVFDVFFHIVDDSRWEAGLRNVCRALVPGGLLVYSDVFAPPTGQADHNRTRVLERHRAVLDAAGMEVLSLRPTHVLLNRELGPWRFLNRAPRLLHAADRVLLGVGVNPGVFANRLLVARRRTAS